MAGDQTDMKENLVYTDDGDPLATLPPFGGAGAELQNSEEKPDFTPIDVSVLSRIVKSETDAQYPLDGPWLMPQWFWKETLRNRVEQISRANNSIHGHYEETMKGKDYDVAIATGFLSDITPEINQIAASQFEQGFDRPKSWREVNQKASNILGDKITLIMQDQNNVDFFTRNTSVKKGLELINDVLIASNDPDFIFENHSEYMKSCIEANAKGRLIFYIPFESDFTNPVKNENEKTQICEAMVSVIVPLGKTAREEFDKLTDATWNLLKSRKNAHKTNSRLNVIVGTNIMGAGFEALDSTVGESYILKSGEGHEHGFYLAVNNLSKKMKFWRASGDLFNVESSADLVTYYKNLVLLYILHEEGHRLFPEHGINGEVPADIPAVIKSLKISLNPELLGRAGDVYKFDTQEVFKAIITEYVSEIINSVSDKDWFEGHNANSGNDLYDGYLLSAVVIMNAIAESGTARINREGKIDIELSASNIAKLFEELEIVDAKFHEKDPKILEVIKLAVANPAAREIISLYRKNLNPSLFFESILSPQKTEAN